MRLRLILLAVWVMSVALANANNNFHIKTVVIDPGHGGKDPGAIGQSRTNEKDIALAVSLKLGEYIQRSYPNVNVIYTRKTDEFVELHERAELANKSKADLFICVHVNSSPNSETYGTSTYVLGLHRTEANLEVAKRENAVIMLEENRDKNYEFDPNTPEGHIIMSMKQNAFLDQSIDLASKIENEFEDNAHRKSLGVKQAGFYVLYKTTMPSLLSEIGFISNTEEERYLNSAKGQEQIATALYNAFKDYKKDMEGADAEVALNPKAPPAETSKNADKSSSNEPIKAEPQKETTTVSNTTGNSSEVRVEPAPTPKAESKQEKKKSAKSEPAAKTKEKPPKNESPKPASKEPKTEPKQDKKADTPPVKTETTEPLPTEAKTETKPVEPTRTETKTETKPVEKAETPSVKKEPEPTASPVKTEPAEVEKTEAPPLKKEEEPVQPNVADNSASHPASTESSKPKETTASKPMPIPAAKTEATKSSSPPEPKKSTEKPKPKPVAETPPVKKTPVSAASVASVEKPKQKPKAELSGVTFKVQLFALKGELQEREKVSRLFKEVSTDQTQNGFTRYYAGNTTSLDQARKILDTAVSNGYSTAFIVGFKDGRHLTSDEMKEAFRK